MSSQDVIRYIVGPSGIVLAIALVIYLSVKQVNIIIGAIIATVVAIIFNEPVNILSRILDSQGSYMAALATYIMKFFAIFLFGSIFAKYMEESGAAMSIAESIIKKIGAKKPYRILVAIFIISSLLTYGGIALFVVMFVILPLARPLFKRLNISWHLIQVPLWMGMATYTMTILPGSPAIQNLIPITAELKGGGHLKTNMLAAPVPSILGAMVCVTFGLWYMHFSLKRSLKLNQTYQTYVTNDTDEMLEHVSLPDFWKSIIPLISLVLVAISGTIVGIVIENQWLTNNIIYPALLLAIICAVILFHRQLPHKVKTLSLGAQGAIGPIFATSSTVAFGAVITQLIGFDIFKQGITKIPNAQVSLTLVTATLSAITGSSSGTLGIVIPEFGEFYAESLHPEMVHRIAAVASNILTVVPQSGVVITFLSLTKLTYKNGYKDTFISVTFSTLLAQIVIILTGLLIYRK